MVKNTAQNSYDNVLSARKL